MSKTASKIAWILAVIGLVLMIAGVVSATVSYVVIGLYLTPLSLIYPVLKEGKRAKYIGLIAGILLSGLVIISALGAQGISLGCGFGGGQSGCFLAPSVPLSMILEFILFTCGPSVLLLIVSVYSIIKFHGQREEVVQ